MLYEKIKFAEDPIPWKQKGIRFRDGAIPGFDGIVVGVDPGVNFGMTVINLEYVQVLHGKLPRRTKRGDHGIDAYGLIHTYFGTWRPGSKITAIVEGAAYNRMFKQVELEEVRFGFFFGLHTCGFDVHIVPPAAIRKSAFGHGRTQAGDIWPFLNGNGADSVGCALAAIDYKETTQ